MAQILKYVTLNNIIAITPAITVVIVGIIIWHQNNNRLNEMKKSFLGFNKYKSFR